MGAIYRHGGHLDLQTVTIFKNFKSPFTQGSTWSLKKFRPGVSEEKLFIDVNGRTDVRMDGRRMITIAHPEPLAQVS